MQLEIKLQPVPTTLTRQEFRRASGRFATGVTVVTAASGEEVHGMTANSFVSVSLDPLLVLVSVANSARMRERLESAGAFGVSILRSDQKAQSDVFAGAPSDEVVTFTKLGGMPVISGGLAAMACRLHETYRCGDHTLCIGEVCELSYQDGQPLLFYNGAYASIGVEGSPRRSPDLTNNIADVTFDMEGFNAVGW
jgi:flavin reductase (DIM6/NTAB) family NADH-FMN oxidoreductase RutF